MRRRQGEGGRGKNTIEDGTGDRFYGSWKKRKKAERPGERETGRRRLDPSVNGMKIFESKEVKAVRLPIFSQKKKKITS